MPECKPTSVDKDRSASREAVTSLVSSGNLWSRVVMPIDCDERRAANCAGSAAEINAIISRSPELTPEMMAALGIDDERVRIQLALDEACRNHSFSREIRKYGIRDQDALTAIAYSQVECGGSLTCEYFQDYGILDSRSRVEIAKRLAVSNGWAVAKYIRNFDLTSQDDLVELAMLLADTAPWGVSVNIRDFRIESEFARIRIAERAAATQGAAVSECIDKFDIQDQVALRRIARIAVSRDAGLSLAFLKNYRIAETSELLELARVALYDSVANYDGILSAIGDCDGRFHEEVVVPFFRDMTGTLGTERVTIEEALSRFESLCSGFSGLLRRDTVRRMHGISVDDWDAMSTQQKVLEIVRWLRRQIPFLDAKGAELEECVRDLSSEHLLSEVLSAVILSWDVADPKRYGSRSKAALAVLSGYDDLPTRNLSSNGFREMWEVLVSAQRVFGTRPSYLVPIRFASPASALEAVSLLTTLCGLGGEMPTYEAIASHVMETSHVIDDARRRIAARFQELVGAEGISHHDIARLLERCGNDISPFTVLGARFRHHEEWHGQIAILGEIAKHVSSGTFHDWRYRTFDGQLNMLSPAGIKAWRGNPSVFELVSAAEVSSEDEREEFARRDALAIFKNNILPHLSLSQKKELEDHRSRATGFHRLTHLSETAFRENVKSIAHAIAILQDAVASGSMDDIRALIGRINSVKQELLRGVTQNDPDLAKQLARDLSSIKDAFRRIHDGRYRGHYVFSTITDDPKLLLMTGELVPTASCQSYKTGNFVGALPGYVVDANIKLAVSFVVSEGDFETFRRRAGFASNVPLAVCLDAPRLRLLVSDAGGSSGMWELPLHRAVSRQILRLGSDSNGGAVLFAERPYAQSHIIATRIAEQQTRLIHSFAEAVEGKMPTLPTTIHFPPSRNSGGVYSDGSGGVCKGPYSITLHSR